MSTKSKPQQTLIFAGTPEFAAEALKALIDAGHLVPLVLTQPDRPSGRGLKLQASPVKVLAQAHGLRVEQPSSLRDPAVQGLLKAVIADAGVEVMVVAAYGLILPQAVLDLLPGACLNIHASLLPRWRGAAPIQRAIEAGDSQTGVGIMQMEVGLDTGPVLLEAVIPIDESSTGTTLHDQLACSGAQLIVDALAQRAMLMPRTQASTGVTYAHKLDKAEGQLDLSRSATELARRIRAFDPSPGCSALLEVGLDEAPTVKFWAAQPTLHSGTPGEILQADASGVLVACGTGALRVTELQKPGGKRLIARDFLAGFLMRPGQRFRCVTSADRAS